MTARQNNKKIKQVEESQPKFDYFATMWLRYKVYVLMKTLLLTLDVGKITVGSSDCQTAQYKNPMQQCKKWSNQWGVVQKSFSTSIIVQGSPHFHRKRHLTNQQIYIKAKDPKVDTRICLTYILGSLIEVIFSRLSLCLSQKKLDPWIDSYYMVSNVFEKWIKSN